MRRRFMPISIALALAGSTLVASSASSSSAVVESAQAKRLATPFGLVAASFGTRVIGGAVPVESSELSYEALSCTNKAGIDRRNYAAQVDLGALGTARGVSSRTWTTKTNGVVSSWAEHSVARVNLFHNSLGSLDINGVSSLSRAYHDSTGFHAQTSSEIASITFTPTNGTPVGIKIPTIGRPITVPGLLRISLGASDKKAHANGAQAVAAALDIGVLPLGTKVIIAQTKATISNGIKSGVFVGNASGVKANVLGSLVGVGANPQEFMPCRGTQGKPLVKEIAGVKIGGLLEISGLYAGMQGNQTNKRANGVGAAHVAKIDIGGGRLVITGIHAVAEVTRVGNKITRSTDGTKILEIMVDGEPYTLPIEDLDLPGLVELEENVVENTRYGLRITALRIKLLDGSAAVIDLGNVSVGIKGAGKRR
jgi:hypothetical protein